MKNTVQNQHWLYVDVAKAIGMLCIIWAHIMLVGVSYHAIYAFSVPLFFFISGMLYKQEKYSCFKQFLLQRVKTLLVPYVIYSVLTWGLWAVFSLVTGDIKGGNIWYPLLQTFIAQGSGSRFLLHNGVLWFVTCLFVVEVVYYFIAKFPDIVNVCICIIFAIIGICIANLQNIINLTTLPWNIDVVCVVLLFYALGNLIIKWKSHLFFISKVTNKYFWIVTILLLTCVIIGGNLNNSQSIESNLYGNSFMLYYVLALLGIYMVLTLSAGITYYCKESNFIVRNMQWFGRNSFDAMALHNPIKNFIIVSVIYLLHISKKDVNENLGYALLVFALTLPILIVCMYVCMYVCKVFKKQK